MKQILRCRYALACLLVSLSFCACTNNSQTPPNERQTTASNETLKIPSIRKLATGEEQPPDSASFPDIVKRESHDWFYGKGLGATMLNVGAVVAFPPYAIYILGNAGIAMAGYEPLYLTDALPDKAQKGVNEVYDMVAGAPGRLTSKAAGEEYHP